MTIFEAVLLGLIQGLTEFLPISSSGHLVIVQKLLGFIESPVLFDIFVHAGTLVAILVFFKKRIVEFFSNLANLKLIFISSLPVVLVGLLVNRFIGQLFNSLFLVGLNLVITGTLLFFTKRKTKKTQDKITIKNGLVIGLFQALAILPGASRSGLTISAALYQGIGQSQAFSFSFFLVIPAIVGALVLQTNTFLNGHWVTMPDLVGFLTALVVGYFSLKLLQTVLKRSQLYRFAYYCWFLGGILLWIQRL